MPHENDVLAREFSSIARQAGAAIMAVYATGTAARFKEDRSPVTEADEIAEAIILDRLAALLPDVPVVAEESCSRGMVPQVGSRFILVDPLDGTKEFLNRNGEFTVNIALIDAMAPVAGCVFAPAVDALYAGGETAWRIIGADEAPIRTRPYPAEGLTALCSRSHPDAKSEAFLAGYRIADRREAGSSLKFCRLAEGQADVYPRFGPTMEWDVAAGHAVLAAAGGAVLAPDGAPFAYGKTAAGFRNEAFIAWGQRAPASP
ncbi:3'(2'),5'-bisphosphate nucleotidase CysQ [Labrys monachus]|uniref:3'(2'),5'-bisphosphate nucleotidase CysQ n=1 Tax=Labrys monachus TaxID=217067 RepID=A0ABU0FLN3_9HYPH|nr:3'(2'),5'-bisphosphate nucleotidase CysQ [Labrys monachus]MDQ0394950.1 3'(2'), 5'-bisphosphate nucleotidase [Labrys monachus]